MVWERPGTSWREDFARVLEFLVVNCVYIHIIYFANVTFVICETGMATMSGGRFLQRT